MDWTITQKPTVGRQVHYYGKDTAWHRLWALTSSRNVDGAEALKAAAATFRGPFAATVVKVHEGGEGVVNLLLAYPTALYNTDKSSEVVERVLWSNDPRIDGDNEDGCWVWPPKV